MVGNSLQFKDAGRFPQKVELAYDTTWQVLKALAETVDSRKSHQAKFRKHTEVCIAQSLPAPPPPLHPEALLGTLLCPSPGDTVSFVIKVPSSCVSTSPTFLVSPIPHQDPIV